MNLKKLLEKCLSKYTGPLTEAAGLTMLHCSSMQYFAKHFYRVEHNDEDNPKLHA